MEAHPEYEASLRRLRDKGFRIVMRPDVDPNVDVIRYVDATGKKELRVDRVVNLVPGMRYLDLEHEMGHVDQVTDTARFPIDEPAYTLNVHERANGDIAPRGNEPPNFITPARDTVVEYHVRLKEVLWLRDRVSRDVLEEHLEGVALARDACHEAGLNQSRDKKKLTEWANQHFPDLKSLHEEVKEIDGATEAGLR